MENGEQNFQIASSYYNKDRKRSFLFSRIAVITSMLVLVIALMLNLSLLTSPERADTRSQAATITQDDLPLLPEGCVYQQLKEGSVVVCSTPTPEDTTPISANAYASCTPASDANNAALTCIDRDGQSITVPLPSLAGGCIYQPTEGTYIISCANTEVTDLSR